MSFFCPAAVCALLICASAADVTSTSRLAGAGAASLYGLAMVHNSPVEVALSVVAPATGTVTVVGLPLTEVFGMSDLVAVAKGLLFYLGDTQQGATLVGVSLSNGSKVCTKHVDVASQPHIMYQKCDVATSGFEMCFAIGSKHLRCCGRKQVSNPVKLVRSTR